MATLIKPDGTETQVHPANTSHGFTLEELYRHIGCGIVEMVRLADGREMWLDEEGKFNSALAPNERATILLVQAGGIPGDFVVGNVLVTDAGEVK